jgi:ribosomal protein L3 glutamine methyltransferase
MQAGNSTLNVAQMIDATGKTFERAQLSYGHGTENAWDEAAWLVLACLGISPQTENFDADIPVSPQQAQRIQELIERRVQTRKPLAYLLNSAWFCGLEFFVDERVIVPRSPIAELIGNDFAPWVKKPPQKILDLCTGSGCIAIACALQFPSAQVDATDISADALTVAAINAGRHAVEDRVRFYQADVFSGLPQRRYDLIVCNPPYVDADDMARLPPEYRQEPGLALAAGQDGLDIVRRLLREAGNFLAADGVIVCEVGNSEEALANAWPRIPFIWLEFEQGGSGVFVLTADELAQSGINEIND